MWIIVKPRLLLLPALVDIVTLAEDVTVAAFVLPDLAVTGID